MLQTKVSSSADILQKFLGIWDGMLLIKPIKIMNYVITRDTEGRKKTKLKLSRKTTEPVCKEYQIKLICQTGYDWLIFHFNCY